MSEDKFLEVPHFLRNKKNLKSEREAEQRQKLQERLKDREPAPFDIDAYGSPHLKE